MSALSSLNVATRALQAQQRALDVTGQNIANANTVGYSRQRAELTSVGGSTVSAVWSTTNGQGGGVAADTVTRIRDAFMEGRALSEHSNSAQLTVESDAYTQVEDTLDEPGTTGLSATLNTMWTSFEDVSGTVTDASSTSGGNSASSRSTVLKNVGAVAGRLNTMANALDSQWSQTRENLGTTIDAANATVTQIAALNKQIQSATQSGLATNELQDKRDSLVLDLAGSIGAVSSTGTDGMVDVSVNGVSLVSGTSSTALKVSGASALSELADKGLSVSTDPGGTAVTVGGTAAGQSNVLTTIVPAYATALDDVAVNLASVLNTAQAAGALADGTAGEDLLGASDGSTTVTAKNISLLTTDGSKLAASSTVGIASTDTSNAQAMAKLGSSSGINAAYRTVVTKLGVDAAGSSQSLTVQNAITSTVDTSRESVSGVDTDEEMTNLLAYQHGYQAAAKLVTTMTDILDTLINMVGN